MTYTQGKIVTVGTDVGKIVKVDGGGAELFNVELLGGQTVITSIGKLGEPTTAQLATYRAATEWK